MHRFRSNLTYANVMATVAVFIALGGASYAAVKLPKNSVGAKQLKKEAVTGEKVKNGAISSAKLAAGTITRSDIDINSLGTVPSATKAAEATHAQVADSASTLQGMTSAQIVAASKIRCPSETLLAGGLCIDEGNRTSKALTPAMLDCASVGGVMPTESQLMTFDQLYQTTPTPDEWAGGEYLDEGVVRGVAVGYTPVGLFSWSYPTENVPHQYRCGFSPTN